MQPNLVIVQSGTRFDCAVAPYMPHLEVVWKSKGQTYSNAFTTTALAGIARANFLTGQLASKHGYVSHHDADSIPRIMKTSLATRLQAVGYTTACIGQFVYAYSNLGPPNGTTWYVAPGWDHWWVPANDPLVKHLGYTIVTGPETTFTAGTTDANYLIDKMGAEAVAWIAAREAAGERPWCCYLAPPGNSIPTRHLGAFDGAVPFRPPAHNEADVRDKCAGIQVLDPVDPAFVDQARIKHLTGLLAVDDLCKTLFETVQHYDPLNTILAFVGQGGPFWGEHRLGAREAYPGNPSPWLRFAQNQPYDEAHRAPVVLVYPRALVAGSIESRLTTLQDITAKLVRWGGGLVGGMDHQGNRRTVPLEGWQAEGEPFYTGSRTRTRKVVVWYTDEQEEYDLAADPCELTSLD